MRRKQLIKIFSKYFFCELWKKYLSWTSQYFLYKALPEKNEKKSFQIVFCEV